MQVYPCFDEASGRGNQVISALYEDDRRQLWVGTDNGVYIQDLSTGKFSFFDAKTDKGEQISGQWVEDILSDPSRQYMGERTQSGSIPLSRSHEEVIPLHTSSRQR
ncbi:hypothetical protein NXX42_02895 [Bacteroides thetaiotaomicron]|nr:hypothetical protein [Bacteroides thetaiotaomicron]